mgnify:FL=1
MSECDQLRGEIQRLRQEIAALGDQYILKSERQGIINQSVDLSKLAIPAVVTGIVAPEFGQIRQRLEITFGNANRALGQSSDALSNADRAALRAREASNQAATSLSRAQSAVQNAELATEVGQRAFREAQVAKTTASRASGAVAGLRSRVARINTRVGSAVTTARRAIGISDDAARVAGRAFRLAGRALGFIDLIFGILATLTIASQLAAIIRRLDVVERTLDPIFGLIGVNRSAARRADRNATNALQRARNATGVAQAAQSTADGAASTGASNLQRIITLLATVQGLRFLANAIPSIRTTADTALSTARRALTRQGVPGPAGPRGPQGAPGRNGTFADLTAAQRNALRGPRGLTGAPGPQGLQGIPGSTAEVDSQNKALLGAILKQTQVNGRLSSRNGSLLGALSTAFATTAALVANTWNFLQVDRFLNYANYAVNLHNAYYLSRGAAEGIGFMIDSVLRVVGLELTDAEGNEVGLAGLTSKFFSNSLTTIFGEENLTEVKEKFDGFNRIYQSAQNVFYLSTSIVDSTRSIAEVTGSMVGKIGNALMKSGSIAERSFGWMPERLDQVRNINSRWDNLFTKIDTIEQTTSNVAAIAGEVTSIQDTRNELINARAQLQTDINAEATLSEDTITDTLPTPTESNPNGTTDVSTPPLESTVILNQFNEDKLDSEAPVTLENALAGLPE